VRQLSALDGIAVSAEKFMVAYLAPTFTNVGTEMEHGAPKPFYLVRRVSGREDMVSDYPTMSVHVFADTRTHAHDAARLMHVKMKALDAKVAVTVEGHDYSVDFVDVDEVPIWVDYDDKTVHRYVGRYTLGLRLL
jgi:hypothetical protein